MDEKLVTIKAAEAAAFTALGTFLGWKGIMAMEWLARMILDYITELGNILENTVKMGASVPK